MFVEIWLNDSSAIVIHTFYLANIWQLQIGTLPENERSVFICPFCLLYLFFPMFFYVFCRHSGFSFKTC